MGNCSSCCGKADTNEIVTEKNVNKLKGVGSGKNDPLIDEVKKYGKTGGYQSGSTKQGFNDHFNGDLEINNEAYNNPRVMVS